MKRSYANRGKWFEKAIETVNTVYKIKKIAIVNKIPTPININTRGKKAFYEEKSTVDFMGIMRNGKHIAFDTKEVSLTRFPFKNVSDHQEEYLTDTHKMGGTAFLLVYFKTKHECYLLHITEYIKYKAMTDRKSIPYEWFKEHAIQVTSSNGVAFDYMSYLDVQSINNLNKLTRTKPLKPTL